MTYKNFEGYSSLFTATELLSIDLENDNMLSRCEKHKMVTAKGKCCPHCNHEKKILKK
jgi:hypothetical protein